MAVTRDGLAGPAQVDETITLLNPGNGWMQNCNSTPYTAAG
jgi:acyl-homoserine-lactone acylase